MTVIIIIISSNIGSQVNTQPASQKKEKKKKTREYRKDEKHEGKRNWHIFDIPVPYHSSSIYMFTKLSLYG